MLHRNKERETKMGEPRFLFAGITRRYGRDGATQCDPKPDGRASQGERGEAPGDGPAIAARQPASMHRCCTCTPMGLHRADDNCCLSIRAAI
ncbi:hypothetical protein [Burkholderia arboris]|uniref:hypothetical protein n=1 Tax=Burkholderia arboris TaxID=488730 RepID=UPI001F38751F|nr:hypothetical protein [Burkholderia arboris]UTV56640.1 hypothetical protein NLX30_04850 [Burkholderia arboris]